MKSKDLLNLVKFEKPLKEEREPRIDIFNGTRHVALGHYLGVSRPTFNDEGQHLILKHPLGFMRKQHIFNIPSTVIPVPKRLIVDGVETAVLVNVWNCEPRDPSRTVVSENEQNAFLVHQLGQERSRSKLLEARLETIAKELHDFEDANKRELKELAGMQHYKKMKDVLWQALPGMAGEEASG